MKSLVSVTLLALLAGALAADGTSSLARDLAEEFAKKETGNFVESPYSIAQALELARQGARGKTREEIEAVLKGGCEKIDLDQVRVANHLWGEKTYSFKEGFTIDRVDFKKAPDEARKTINERIAKETEDRIKDFFPEGMIDRDTRLVLTNATYLKATWEHPFPHDATKRAPFHLADGSTVSVPFMHAPMPALLCKETKDQTVIELLYKDSTLVFDAIVPADMKTGTLDLAKATASLEDEKVDLLLPRFELATEVDLKPVLEALGMKTAFTDAADLSGFTGGKDLYVSDAFTKAWVKVDEEGTEAAAATGMNVKTCAAISAGPEIRIDRPFWFAIRDTKSGAVLFAGRVMNPAKSQSTK